jgi:glycosyltransferase involved in cell wall biosynthesis
MELFVNARFLTQPISGVQRYGIECSLQIKQLLPETAFLTPPGVLHHQLAGALNAQTIGSNKGHLWEQYDLPRHLIKKNNPPLFNPANTAPLFYKNNFVTIHDLAFYHHPEWNKKTFATWYNLLVPRLARSSKHLFTVSNTIKSELTEFFKVPEQKISITYNGISQKMVQLEKRTTAKEKIILSVGSFNIRKNHDKLIRAFLQSSLKDSYTLIIVGDKHEVFRQTGVDESELNNRVKICYHFTDEELIQMYQKAEVVVSLSAYEGFGIPILEGLFAGCKALCADIPAYRELYSKYAYFCNTQDMANIAHALGEVIHQNTPKTEELSSLLQLYNYKHSAETIVEKMRSRYNS